MGAHSRALAPVCRTFRDRSAHGGPVSRRLSLFLLTAIFGGGWYYLGAPGLPPDFPFGQQPGGHQQHSGGYSSTGQFPASPVATQSPATFGRQAGTVSQPGGPTIRIASFNIPVFGTHKG